MNDEKMAETLVFPEENNECFPNFEVFNENEILETSNDLDDTEISLFIEENRSVLKYNRKYKKLTSSPLKKQGPLKKFPPRNLTTFYVICLSKSGNGTHHQQMHNCCRSEISTAISSKTTRG